MPFLKDGAPLEPFKKPDYVPRNENIPSQNSKSGFLNSPFFELIKRRDPKMMVKQEVVKKISVKESTGIFDEHGKAQLKDFTKAVKKYREGGLAGPERDELAKDIPNEYQTVYKGKIKNYVKGLKPGKFDADDHRNYAEKSAEINKSKKLLKDLLEGKIK